PLDHMHLYAAFAACSLAAALNPVLISLPSARLLARAPAPALFPYTTLFRSPAATAAVDRSFGSTAPESASATTSPVRVSCTGERSEEHTSELQSRENLVCRLLLEKKNLIRSAWSTTTPN